MPRVPIDHFDALVDIRELTSRCQFLSFEVTTASVRHRPRDGSSAGSFGLTTTAGWSIERIALGYCVFLDEAQN